MRLRASRRSLGQWLRGRDARRRVHPRAANQISNLRTELGDVNERVSGDLSVVTRWVDQTYTYDDAPARISVPTTLIFRPRRRRMEGGAVPLRVPLGIGEREQHDGSGAAPDSEAPSDPCPEPG